MITFQTILIIFYLMLGFECLLFIPFSIKYKQLDKATKFIYYYIASSILFAGGSIICGYCFKNNMCLFAVMHFCQSIILSFFYKELIEQPIVKLIIKIMILVLSLIALLDFFVIEGKEFFNSIFVTIRNVFLMVYGFIFFIQLLKDKKLIEKEIYMNSLPAFWFNTAIFIYLGCSFMFGLGANLLQVSSIEEQKNFLVVLAITYIVGIVQIILLYIGFCKIFYLDSKKIFNYKRY